MRTECQELRGLTARWGPVAYDCERVAGGALGRRRDHPKGKLEPFYEPDIHRPEEIPTIISWLVGGGLPVVMPAFS